MSPPETRRPTPAAGPAGPGILSEAHRPPRVLVVDDEASIRLVLREAFSRAGLQVQCAASLAEGRALDPQDFDVVFLDAWLPDGDGLSLLPFLREVEAPPHVIVMTAHSGMEVPVQAMKAGARDFVAKPFDVDQLTAMALDLAHREKAQGGSSASRVSPLQIGRLLGSSPAMVELFKAIGKIAPSDETVLVVGESGTGKELVARALHDHSRRAQGPFITVNCAAIPAELMESELFGHERGAFTGADRSRKGKFELAQGGTLVLDEIGELPLALQAKLLRVLQERQIERLGATHSIGVDLRVIALTHRDLQRMVLEERFREDLYYRLDVARLRLPALRERGEDLVHLTGYFVERDALELRGNVVRVSDQTHRYLASRRWPGNVRELENAIKRALLDGRGALLGQADFEGELLGSSADAPGPEASRAKDEAAALNPALPGVVGPGVVGPGVVGQSAAPVLSLNDAPLELIIRARLERSLNESNSGLRPKLHATVMAQVERALIGLVLERVGGNQLEAARRLGMNRNTLRKRIDDLDIRLPERRKKRH